jgi:predicted lysophospholipase L1 biosynthesis ABC-type transport system permease subunit
MFETQRTIGIERSWLGTLSPLLIAVFLTPIALLVGIGTSIEGDLFYTKIVFPFSVNFLALFRWAAKSASAGSVGVYFGLAIVQVPLYGLVITLAKRRDITFVILMGVHFLFVILAFVVTYLLGI